MKIPHRGMERAEVVETLGSFKARDLDWRSGRTWAYVYDAGDDVDSVVKTAYTMYMSENGLDPTAFPSLLHLENSIVRMMASHLGGDNAVVGNFTSGGTESIILAVKTAREHFRATHPDAVGPAEIVLPSTAHAAFQKAAYYLDIKPVIVPVHSDTFKADVDAVRNAITSNTCLIVGSAPSYAHGVIDPITDLAALAAEHNVLFHVNACIGGFLLPYFKRLGAPVPDFDLSVPGVTSLSVDLHKYGFAAKGASVVLYKNKDLRRHQIYACSTWTGYTIINNTIQSTKSGGPLAAAWAVLNYLGDDGYMALARSMYDATARFIEGIRHIDDLYIMGQPEMNLVTITSDTVDVFHIADEMKERGWYVQPQLAYGDLKENIHLSINPKALDKVDAMLSALRDSVEAAKHLPTSPMVAMVRDALATIDPDQLGGDQLTQMLAMAGVHGVALPERMADINAILNALPPRIRERLLTAFVNDMYI